MAHYEQQLRGDVDALIAHLDRAIPAGSISAKLEDQGDHRVGDARMVVRVYERYSAVGGNRVSLCVSVLSVGDEMSVSAITAGGSQAVFWKLNTFGERAFLDRAIDALRDYAS
jgi:hypothetical protein